MTTLHSQAKRAPAPAARAAPAPAARTVPPPAAHTVPAPAMQSAQPAGGGMLASLGSTMASGISLTEESQDSTLSMTFMWLP